MYSYSILQVMEWKYWNKVVIGDWISKFSVPSIPHALYSFKNYVTWIRVY